jgi:hypothetical protein
LDLEPPSLFILINISDYFGIIQIWD